MTVDEWNEILDGTGWFIDQNGDGIFEIYCEELEISELASLSAREIVPIIMTHEREFGIQTGIRQIRSQLKTVLGL